MLKKTALYEVHVGLGAKMVPFAGYSMPIQYQSILEEHKRVRAT
ncbi:MAG: glycine cleavage system aminomethyltransferase GcvT, partial [Calditrichaeota bacterium]|nr:glycine cleavage system aminomethyltransferase GcvT [Calditrichota bacterium]